MVGSGVVRVPEKKPSRQDLNRSRRRSGEVCKLTLLVTGLVCVGLGMIVLVVGQ